MLRRPVASNLPGLSKNWDTCFIVKDNAGQKLAFVYFEDEPAGDRRPSCSRKMRRGESL
jgi:hypothetical protein